MQKGQQVCVVPDGWLVTICMCLAQTFPGLLNLLHGLLPVVVVLMSLFEQDVYSVHFLGCYFIIIIIIIIILIIITNYYYYYS